MIFVSIIALALCVDNLITIPTERHLQQCIHTCTLPENVFGVDFRCKTLFAGLAQSEVVDEAAIAAPRVA